MNIRPGKLLVLLLSSYIAILGACSKSNSDTQEPPVIPPPVTPVDSSVKVNLYYPGRNGFARQYELIISTASGKSLLDSVSDVDKFTLFAFKTSEKLLDVTTITENIRAGGYFADTYRAVNPIQWDSINGLRRPFTLIEGDTGSNANLYCYNLPSNYDNNVYVGSYGGLGRTSPHPTSVDYMYESHSGNPVIILLPSLALYKIYYPVGKKDTVKITEWDMAVSKNFVRPPQYQLVSLDLHGSVDTSEKYQSLHLYHYIYNSYDPHDPPSKDADIEYPDKYLQTYELNTMFINTTNNDVIYHFRYGDTVAYRLDFPDETNYSLTSAKNDNFSMKFINIQPTYCNTEWRSADLIWDVFAPTSDSMSLDFLGMANSLKGRSHYLSERNLNDIKCSGFTFEIIDKTDYTRYVEFSFNSKNRVKRSIYSATMYTKTF